MISLGLLVAAIIVTIWFPRLFIAVGLFVVIAAYVAALPAFIFLLVWALAQACSG